MTVIEQRTMEAVQSINRKMRDQNQVNWEQRRYEIAREILPFFLPTENELILHVGEKPTKVVESSVKQAVMFADALIQELKKPKI